MTRPKIFLISFGKLKTAGFTEAVQHYRNLLRPWVQLEEMELKPVPQKDPSFRSLIQEQEGHLLESALEANRKKNIAPSAFYLLDEQGRAQRTQDWSRFFENHPSTLSFCLGSSFGFSPSLKKKATGLFSLGPQTLSHELARLVFLEQLYRAWSLLKRHPYHNEG